jgi:hypothetical protein
VVSYSMNAGDASFHAGEILHATDANNSSERREVLAVIYYADGTRVMDPLSEYRRADLNEFLPGLKPGESAASPLNPIVYSFDEEVHSVLV